MRDPQTPAEWQEAIDVAKFFLALDDARLYGLVRGGPEVDADRCVELLERGAAMGITPSPDAVERGVAAWNSRYEQ